MNLTGCITKLQNKSKVAKVTNGSTIKNKLRFWNVPGKFCEPQPQMLAVPVNHHTPTGPGRGFVSVVFQELYRRHGTRQGKRAWTETEQEKEAEGGLYRRCIYIYCIYI